MEEKEEREVEEREVVELREVVEGELSAGGREMD